MKAKHICIFISSFILTIYNAQVDSLKVKKNIDSTKIVTKNDSIKKRKIAFNQIFVGVDFFNPINGFFSEKKGFQGMVSFHVKKKWHGVIELGYEKNTFDKINWNIDVNGLFYKVGFNWKINQDYENSINGFILGARIAGANYKQTVNQYPIYYYNNTISGNTSTTTTEVIYKSLPQTSASAYWMELALGGKIQIKKSRFYGDFLFQPKFLITGKSKDNDTDPIVVPGFGKSTSGFNFSVYWGISYHIK